MTIITQAPTDAALTQLALDAAIAAAKVIMDIYGRPIAAVAKSDGSPVTEADAAAEAVLLDLLKPTGIPVLGEESVAAGIIPLLGERYFVVDPLDGTKEFIKRNGEFTVNIALVEHGVPVMGMVLAPATGETFVGDASGAYGCNTQSGTVANKHLITVAGETPLRIVASRSHGHAALASLCQTLEVESDVSVGSSLKFCLLARGDAQLYPRFTPTCEWDTAAGQAVLEAAGGAVVTLDGARLGYGKGTDKFLNPYFVAAANADLARRAAAEMTRLLG
ncbi:3'(2'),5'-bisphosphate nucleotidase CysQ [Devosia neptuniae]|jgi:3'(2'), 5'-bisphosphate nucleotidase|uniref:3'(2'),5'-bisphosphate nucleotidase CysQ n=1 Tax=Devosia TaxID=46913 RepID=UPI0022AE8A20|nr:3'(2'),5'-bisphosphate nucleotidase CysQ [Devosia neptuniae]MCZ4344952.1 3'(2'),5'-bisphosphate nucleotidase CysQ [Devosia neptuniae]|tara:strand:- start:9750 stop:10580 length:831 start_codon:yes stop_codon:yes gene_type:complete